MSLPTASQRYLSTRGGSYDFTFENVVLKGLASDGGLFIPEEIPTLPREWQSQWKDASFQDLAFNIFSLYISPQEIPAEDLRDIIHRSYSTFRAPNVTPLVTLDESKNLHLLELFHGPTFAFKDVALQFVGNLFEYFLVRRNKGMEGEQRQHLTVVGATSGDTGSAAIYGLRGKKDVSVFIMYPKGKVSPIQEAQMTTVADNNVHCVSVEGTFDDCQGILKTLFSDPETNQQYRLAAVNSINWARILAQITYYFHSYLSLCRQTSNDKPNVRFVVPTGNFGDILAGYFAKQMGLPVAKLVVATNENDILHRFWKTGHYEKKPVHGQDAEGGIAEDGAKAHEDGVKETLSPAMDILVSSNFERLLWYLAFSTSDIKEVNHKRMHAGELVKGWLGQLKTEGGFGVSKEILAAAKEDFESERVSDEQTLATIREIHGTTLPKTQQANGTKSAPTSGTQHDGHYILDPHSAIGVAASLRSIETGGDAHHIALSTAHPAKFSHAVELALKDVPDFSFDTVLPEQFVGMTDLPQRASSAKNDWKEVREVIGRELETENR
ncbi:threonine synthase-like protein [Neohortaea acidophila]|uniref:threonine synthase n=1 Tax=Neohortaea acidophila TaxID=245834 RepID=A0A6A6PRZ2_9PEZI|nr:threonine synthase-like protein [Neohortaea acidophila]KAF2482870.1 threonine synthase-like protein [Neohortaea acidophila]